jgi:DNA-binding CsgD family transcriptional regulator
MTDLQALEEGRAAFERGAWSEAYARLAALDGRTPLDPGDLDRLATAAYLVGEDAASDQARTRAHAGFLERGDAVRAARSAFWLVFALSDRPGQQAQAAGWLARAQRLLDDVKEPCVERGWLLCASARQRAAEGDVASAHARFAEAAQIAARFGNRDLLALARHGEGRALLMMNQATAGLTLLDEVMVAVAGGEIAPMVAGVVYCSVISACHSLFDLRRAQEWTAALQGWCASHPDLVPFRGYCLVRRSELMQLHGAWQDAISEAQRACGRLAHTPRAEAGAAWYQLAELHRLRGEFNQAEEAYRLASQAGCKPQPGLALLRLSQGQTEAAEAAIRLALKEARDRRARVLLLGAGVEILLVRDDVAGARAASDELAQLAGQLAAPFLRALSAQASGAVALAEGRALDALELLRAAGTAWQELDAPYELARARVLIGLACRQLGDHEGGQLELDAAHDAFETLGAAPAIARVTALTAATTATTISTGLTGRELEVLRLIATGDTNRAIAERLGISEKTVARHVSNIFLKLDLSSRTAAAAFAYEHKLL